MLMQWNEQLSTGVPEVDSQHKEIISRVNSLLEASTRGQGRAEVGKVIDFLGSYVVAHFAAEEKVMLNARFPRYEAHRKLHADFLADFAQLRAQFDREGATPLLVIQLQRRVVAWLVEHINKEDKAIGQFLRAQR